MSALEKYGVPGWGELRAHPEFDPEAFNLICRRHVTGVINNMGYDHAGTRYELWIWAEICGKDDRKTIFRIYDDVIQLTGAAMLHGKPLQIMSMRRGKSFPNLGMLAEYHFEYL